MSVLLKPCPFCGGEAYTVRYSGDERNAYADRVVVGCRGCGARVFTQGDTSKAGYADNSMVANQAIEKWNRRISDD